MAGPIRIDDPSDPRLEAYRAVRERDLGGRGGGFIAEGVVVLEKLLSAGRHPLGSVLVAERRLAALAPLLERVPPEAPIYAAGQAVMDQLVGFHIHRGVLAAGRRAEPSAQALIESLPREALVVGLVGIANHDNMGGLFRNAAAFGAAAVLVDEASCDPLYRKAIRVSVGAALTTPFARGGPAQGLCDLLAAAGFRLLALSPGGKSELADTARTPRTAALFGAEGPGLPRAVLDRAETVRIAMAGGFDSLNVATAAGIVLHHLAAARGRSG